MTSYHFQLLLHFLMSTWVVRVMATWQKVHVLLMETVFHVATTCLIAMRVVKFAFMIQLLWMKNEALMCRVLVEMVFIYVEIVVFVLIIYNICIGYLCCSYKLFVLLFSYWLFVIFILIIRIISLVIILSNYMWCFYCFSYINPVYIVVPVIDFYEYVEMGFYNFMKFVYKYCIYCLISVLLREKLKCYFYLIVKCKYFIGIKFVITNCLIVRWKISKILQ